jgi:hypothetical protein
MSTVEQAQKINHDIERWTQFDGVGRAQLVLDWCVENGISTASLNAHQLYEAMGHMRYTRQGPDDYLDMAQSLAGFLKSLCVTYEH